MSAFPSTAHSLLTTHHFRLTASRAPRTALTVLTLTFAPVLLAPALIGPALAQDVARVPVTVQLSVEQERQVERIGMKIHCPICSGESIAQSQTDISRQMMNEVREMVKAGRSEQEILNTFAASYGERILLEPPRTGVNSLLWTLPIAFAVIGGLLWWNYTQKASRPVERTLTPEEEKRIQDLMADRE